jgi:hypothetical protein
MKRFRACALLLGLLAALPLASAAVAPQRTELTSDHYESKTVDNETRALFVGSVTLTGTNLRVLCDRLEIIAEGVGDKTSTAPELDRFKYLLATGHVRIVQGDREATCGRAEVLPRDDKVVLTEEPVVIDHGSDLIYAGEKITLLRGERRVIVEKVRTSGPALKDLGFDKNQPPEAPAPAAKP